MNSLESEATGLVSGITQGIASFIITLVVVFAVTGIYNLLLNDSLRVILPAVIVVCSICFLMVIIHSIVGTPHIFYTIAPSLTVAFVFCIVTAYSLRKSEIKTRSDT